MSYNPIVIAVEIHIHFVNLELLRVCIILYAYQNPIEFVGLRIRTASETIIIINRMPVMSFITFINI